MSRVKKFIPTIIICFAMAISCLLPFNMQTVSAEQTGSITIEFPAANSEFQLYKIGECDENGVYTLKGKFSAYSSVDLSDKGSPALLADYIDRDGIVADVVCKTDENGKVVFLNLEKGLYLVTGDPAKVSEDAKTYTPSPTFVPIPQTEDEVLTYDITIKDKYSSESLDEITVVKIWKDDDEGTTRPTEITVQLLKDGQVFEEVKLNKSNAWTYTWKNLDENSTWKVVEKEVASGYTVTRTQEGTKIAITNTYSNPGDEKPKDKLPQTGQLWWPVCILLILGLFFIWIGLLLRKREIDGE